MRLLLIIVLICMFTSLWFLHGIERAGCIIAIAMLLSIFSILEYLESFKTVFNAIFKSISEYIELLKQSEKNRRNRL